MKLMRIKTFAVGLVIAALALTQYSCAPDGLGTFHSSELLAPATSTVAVNTIKDSTAMVDYTISAVGRLYVVVIPGDATTATPDATTLLKLNTANAVFTKQIILSDAASLGGSVKITGLIQNTSYRVFALPVNADGVLGVIVTTDAFTTGDTHAPILTLSSGVSPAISSSAAQTTTFKPVLTFNEPVVLNSAIAITIGYRNAVTGVISLVDVPAANIAIASNKVTITQPQVALAGQYLFLSIGATSIKDRSGNYYAGVTSTLTGAVFSGIYWRVSLAPTAAQQVLPTETVTTDVAMKIKLDYPIKMRFPGTGETAYDQTKVLVRYTTATTTLDVQVPVANVAVVQDTLVQITLPRTPVFGETVTFSMAEGTMRNSYGNPSAAIAFGTRSWFVSYGYARTLIIGTYTAHCVSIYDDPSGSGIFPAYDYSVTIAAKAGSTTGVTITGLLGSSVPINGVFNGDLGTLTVAAGQSLGDLMGDGSIVNFGGFASSTTNAVGTISAAGTITMDWGGRIVGGTYNGYVYDKYLGSIWTKTSKGGVSPTVKKPTVKFKE